VASVVELGDDVATDEADTTRHQEPAHGADLTVL
jgi:hypothetical protein